MTTLRPPTTSGSARRAGEPEVELLADWLGAFLEEAGDPGHVEDQTPQERRAANLSFVRERLTQGVFWVWEDEGELVSMAAARPPAMGFARIGPLYTPPESRGRGYAARVTAHAARAILDAGATPCLFTDLANPTSNGVYQRIGFEPVLDTVTVRIDRPSAR